MEAQSTPAPFALGPENPAPGRIDFTKPIRTKAGKNRVRIFAIDYSLSMPVVGAAEGTDEALTWNLAGEFIAGRSSGLDLENAPERADSPALDGGAA